MSVQDILLRHMSRLVIFSCHGSTPVSTGAPFGSSEKGCQLACLLEWDKLSINAMINLRDFREK